MAELTVPQVDFSAIGQLPQSKQGQADALRQQTLANLGQGGTADAAALLKSGDLSLAQLGINMQNHQDTLRQQAAAEARQAQRDKVGDQHWSASYELQKQAAARANEGVPEKAADRAKAAVQFGLTPDMPEFKSFVLTGSLPESSNKPVPVETIGGTKFMVRNPNGGYSMVDPNALSSGGAPAVSVQPAAASGQPAVPGQPTAAQPPAPTQPPIDADTVDPKTGRREGYLQSLDPQVRDYIKKVADYEIDPRTTSVKGGMREKLMSAVAKYDPTYNQNDFGARAKAIKDFSTGPQGNIVRSFDVAVDHLDTLQKAADAMKNGDTKVLNAIRNAWREQTGSDLPTNFKSLVPLVSGEIAKAVIGSNNALSDREELRANLQAAQSPEQIGGVISSYKALMGGQLKGLKKQYEESTGKKDFEHRIRDATRRELEGGAKSEPGVTSTGVKWSVE
jgi:hypothetical protein